MEEQNAALRQQLTADDRSWRQLRVLVAQIDADLKLMERLRAQERDEATVASLSPGIGHQRDAAALKKWMVDLQADNSALRERGGALEADAERWEQRTAARAGRSAMQRAAKGYEAPTAASKAAEVEAPKLGRKEGKLLAQLLASDAEQAVLAEERQELQRLRAEAKAAGGPASDSLGVVRKELRRLNAVAEAQASKNARLEGRLSQLKDEAAELCQGGAGAEELRARRMLRAALYIGDGAKGELEAARAMERDAREQDDRELRARARGRLLAAGREAEHQAGRKAEAQELLAKLDSADGGKRLAEERAAAGDLSKVAVATTRMANAGMLEMESRLRAEVDDLRAQNALLHRRSDVLETLEVKLGSAEARMARQSALLKRQAQIMAEKLQSVEAEIYSLEGDASAEQEVIEGEKRQQVLLRRKLESLEVTHSTMGELTTVLQHTEDVQQAVSDGVLDGGAFIEGQGTLAPKEVEAIGLAIQLAGGDRALTAAAPGLIAMGGGSDGPRIIAYQNASLREQIAFQQKLLATENAKGGMLEHNAKRTRDSAQELCDQMRAELAAMVTQPLQESKARQKERVENFKLAELDAPPPDNQEKLMKAFAAKGDGLQEAKVNSQGN